MLGKSKVKVCIVEMEKLFRNRKHTGLSAKMYLSESSYNVETIQSEVTMNQLFFLKGLMNGSTVRGRSFLTMTAMKINRITVR